jgi:hypothetical protein
MRCCWIALFVGVPIAALAAPVPPDDEVAKLQRAYGTWSAPDKTCSYTLKGGEPRISLPADDQLLGADRVGAKNNAPRVLREVEGDFTATVRVTFPTPGKLPKGYWPYWSGGLVAWESEDQYLVVRRFNGAVNASEDGIYCHNRNTTVNTLLCQGFRKTVDQAFLRLQREGQKATVGWSLDGTKWTDFRPLDVAWGAKVKVGVVAENCIGVPVEITFDRYSLTAPKK